MDTKGTPSDLSDTGIPQVQVSYVVDSHEFLSMDDLNFVVGKISVNKNIIIHVIIFLFFGGEGVGGGKGIMPLKFSKTLL